MVLHQGRGTLDPSSSTPWPAKVGEEVSGMLEAAARAPELKGPAFITFPQLFLPPFLSATATCSIFRPNAAEPLVSVCGKTARFGRKAGARHEWISQVSIGEKHCVIRWIWFGYTTPLILMVV